jgi:hypothetical protein
MPRNSDPLRKSKDAKVAFTLSTLFLALFLMVMLSYVDQLPEYLASCASNGTFAQIGSNQTLQVLYWVNVGCSFAFLALFVAWWLRVGRPWQRANETAFSREAWAGLQAWKEAEASLLSTIRTGNYSAIGMIRFVALLALAVTTVLTAGVMAYVLLDCSTCNSEWQGRCTPVIAGAVAGVGIMFMYTEIRIKFR